MKLSKTGATLFSGLLCRFPKFFRLLLLLHRPFNAEKAAYLRLVKRGSVVLEIGANVGCLLEYNQLIIVFGKI